MNKKSRSTGRGSLGSVGEELLAKREQAGNILHSFKVNQEMDWLQARIERFMKHVKISNVKNFLKLEGAVGEAYQEFTLDLKKEIRWGKGSGQDKKGSKLEAQSKSGSRRRKARICFRCTGLSVYSHRP